ncbi:MAG: hypothetical protein LUD68_01135 [Rikenellaceae bacterium]|nr:hypothetical protein [Rikenellaceae bacterium]
MVSKNAEMEEIVVTSNRPLVRVKGSALIYDIYQLIENRVVSSVYDALLEIPGVKQKRDRISLAGASNVTIIMDGRPTTMSSAQLTELPRAKESINFWCIPVRPMMWGENGN